MAVSGTFSPRDQERRRRLRRNDDVLRKEAAERALLLAQSLMGTNYQNRMDRDGIRNFIGCIQLVLQEPLAVVLLRREKPDGEAYQVLYHTLLDPMVKDHFEAFLHSEFGSSVKHHNIVIPANRVSNRLFNIHTDYFVMLFRLVNFEKDLNKPSEYHSLKNDSGDVQIQEYLRYFSEQSDLLPQFVSDGMIKEFDRRGSEYYWCEGKIRQPEQQARLDYNFLGAQDEPLKFEQFYVEHFHKISRLFDESYDAIRDSPLLRSNAFQPPNIMFALRLFDRTGPRMSELRKAPGGAYPYGVRGLIPQGQKRDILAALETLRKIQKDPRFSTFRRIPAEHRFYFPKPALSHLSYEQLTEGDFPQGGNANFGGDSEFFWRLIESDDSLDIVCQELEMPYGDHARALSDSVFTSGFVSVAQDPFLKTRAMRLSYEKWMMGGRDLDYRRLVYYHYLMSMAAAGAGSMSALVIPGRVGGSVWFTMGYYFTDQESSHKRWLNCYHFYHNIAAIFSRGIRTGAKRLYLKELKDLFYRLVNGAIPATYAKLGVENYCKLINAYFTLLCRVYPFVRVHIEPAQIAAQASDCRVFSCVIQNNRHSFNVCLRDNPYYESTTGASYITVSEVISALQSSVPLSN